MGIYRGLCSEENLQGRVFFDPVGEFNFLFSFFGFHRHIHDGHFFT